MNKLFSAVSRSTEIHSHFCTVRIKKYSEFRENVADNFVNFTKRFELLQQLQNCNTTNRKFDKIFEVKSGQHPVLLKNYFSGEIKLETLVVFEICLGFVDKFDKVLKDPIWKETKRQIVKYKPFVKSDCTRYKSEILTVIRTKL